MPGNAMRMDFEFDSAALPPPLRSRNSARALCEEYVSKLSDIIVRAKRELKSTAQS
jgi:hypothetical protein